MLGWRIGAVKISRIVELENSSPAKYLFGESVTAERIQEIRWLSPHFAEDDGRIKGCIQALVVETPRKRIVVDTCIGNDKYRRLPMFCNLQSGFLGDLEKAGYPRESIDVVLCTHLHTDHVGWNTMWVAGRWVPTFPNARYLIGRTEFEHRAADEEQSGETDDGLAFKDSVKPVFEAGLVDLVATDHRVCDEVGLEPTHGHTPGHVSIRIRSQGEEALITGDFSHHPCQLAQPEWATPFDHDPEAATKTRQRMFRELAGTDVLLIGSHYPTPSGGKVVRDGRAYRLKL